jgi:hypothetical protein
MTAAQYVANMVGFAILSIAQYVANMVGFATLSIAQYVANMFESSQLCGELFFELCGLYLLQYF